MDQRYGRDTTIIAKGKTTYELKDKNCPPNSLVKLCFSSDFSLKRPMSGEMAVGILSGEETIADLL